MLLAIKKDWLIVSDKLVERLAEGPTTSLIGAATICYRRCQRLVETSGVSGTGIRHELGKMFKIEFTVSVCIQSNIATTHNPGHLVDFY